MKTQIVTSFNISINDKSHDLCGIDCDFLSFDHNDNIFCRMSQQILDVKGFHRYPVRNNKCLMGEKEIFGVKFSSHDGGIFCSASCRRLYCHAGILICGLHSQDIDLGKEDPPKRAGMCLVFPCE